MQSKKHFKSVEYHPQKLILLLRESSEKFLILVCYSTLKKSLLPKFQMTFFVGDTVHFYKALEFFFIIFFYQKEIKKSFHFCKELFLILINFFEKWRNKKKCVKKITVLKR